MSGGITTMGEKWLPHGIRWQKEGIQNTCVKTYIHRTLHRITLPLYNRTDTALYYSHMHEAWVGLEPLPPPVYQSLYVAKYLVVRPSRLKAKKVQH